MLSKDRKKYMIGICRKAKCYLIDDQQLKERLWYIICIKGLSKVQRLSSCRSRGRYLEVKECLALCKVDDIV